MREVLGKKLSKGTKKDLDDISTKTGITLKSCRRQVGTASLPPAQDPMSSLPLYTIPLVTAPAPFSSPTSDCGSSFIPSLLSLFLLFQSISYSPAGATLSEAQI